ncbi:HPP family protein [Alteromonas ponticola]|uniref:HPP family protein n=1 Tax=Alteromonas ponticola TaxID=2720613 RepID=A0ABX1R3N3_9ALTE|nr:HPP family protein [Alteromonas ponticola]NMH61052.1 HPP family protein [Alteromonas ponticola]
MLQAFIAELRLYAGIPRGTTSLKEKVVSGLTGALGIGLLYLACYVVSQTVVYTFSMSYIDYFMLIPIAATAVLLFSVPHGALSQPWPVIGGNFFSALVGVFCSQYIDSSVIAASFAVGGAILLMNYLRCVHPPGGATALSAVLGGDTIQSLGYYYALFPVLFSGVLMVVLAIALNYPFRWRLYPAHLFHLRNELPRIAPSMRKSEITLEDFITAVNQHDSFIDITEESWVELFELAKQNAEKGTDHPESIAIGRFYSNGQLGKNWSIRYVTDVSSGKSRKHRLTYQTVAGNTLKKSEQCTVDEFRSWAKFEVVKKTGFWERKL